MSETTGTNPESNDFGSSPESIVEDMMSRPEGENPDSGTSEEAGTQTAEGNQDKPEGEASTENKPSEEAGTKPVAAKTTEEAKVELPKQQAAEYSKELKAHYAKRFGTTLEAAEADKPLMAAIKKAIDGDIYIEQLKAKDAERTAAEAEAAKKTAEPTAAKPAEDAKPAQTTQEYLAQLEKDVESVNNPEMAAAFRGELWTALAGIDVNDPKVAADLKERGIDPDAPVKVLTKYALNISRTVAKEAVEAERGRFAEGIEAIYPGLGVMYQNVVKSNVWDGVKDANEAYADLPDYGTKEFIKTVDTVLAANPWINELDLPGKSAPEVMGAKYEIVARIASGEKVKPADIAAAAEKGRQEGARAAREVSRGKLDSGRTAGSGSSGKGGDESDIVASYNSRHRGL